MTDTAHVAQAKAALRATHRTRRTSRSETERLDAARGFARAQVWDAITGVTEHADDAIGSFLALPSEPNLGLLHTQCTENSRPLAFPRVAGTRTLEWVVGSTAVVHRERPPRVPEPVGPAHPGTVWDIAPLLLVPALAVDASGSRLGQGGAFYDTVLASKTAHARALAVVFDDEVLPAHTVPLGDYDHPVDGYVTPTRLHWFNAPA